MSADKPLISDEFAEVDLDEWRRRVEERLGERSIETLSRRTPDGVDLQPLYTAADLETEVPVVPARASDGWQTCARLDTGDPVEAAAAMAAAGSAGAKAFWMRFDRAARLGLEGDSPAACEQFGRDGLTLHHGSDLVLLLESLSLAGVSGAGSELWLDAGGNALPVTSVVAHCLDAHGGGLESRVLHCGADPLGSLARDGRLPRDLMKLESEMAVLARFSRDHLTGGRAIVVSTEPYHDAGASVVQELAYAVATLSAYLRGLEESGLEVDGSAGEIALRFAVGQDLFVEIAKLRAARLLWTMLLRSCGVEEPPPALIHAVGSRRTATRRDPWNNLLRSTGQAFAAACGGADRVSLDGFDRPYGPSEEWAWWLAQTTPTILAEEALLGRVTDPGAGAYFVESLTRDFARGAWSRAQGIEREGGMKAALVAGRVEAELAAAVEERRSAIAGGRSGIIGVTAFAREDETPLERPSPDRDGLVGRVVARLAAHRAARSLPADEVTYSRNFVVDELVSHASCGATLAELSLHLGDAEGAEEIEPLPRRRDAEPFEGQLGGEKGQ